MRALCRGRTYASITYATRCWRKLPSLSQRRSSHIVLKPAALSYPGRQIQNARHVFAGKVSETSLGESVIYQDGARWRTSSDGCSGAIMTDGQQPIYVPTEENPTGGLVILVLTRYHSSFSSQIPRTFFPMPPLIPCNPLCRPSHSFAHRDTTANPQIPSAEFSHLHMRALASGKSHPGRARKHISIRMHARISRSTQRAAQR
jgi:hypothetical protein